MLQEVECFVGGVCFLVEGLASLFSLLVFVDRCQVDMGMGGFELFHLAVKTVFLQLGAHLSEVFLVLGQVLVILDKISSEPAELLKSLATRQLTVHVSLKLTQTLARVAHCFDLINGLGLVTQRLHEVCHVHV